MRLILKGILLIRNHFYFLVYLSRTNGVRHRVLPGEEEQGSERVGRRRLEGPDGGSTRESPGETSRKRLLHRMGHQYPFTATYLH